MLFELGKITFSYSKSVLIQRKIPTLPLPPQNKKNPELRNGLTLLL